MRLTIALGAATAGNLILGFFIQWTIIATLGPGTETDSYFASLSVPQVFLALFASALVNVYRSDPRGRRGRSSASRRMDDLHFRLLHNR